MLLARCIQLGFLVSQCLTSVPHIVTGSTSHHNIIFLHQFAEALLLRLPRYLVIQGWFGRIAEVVACVSHLLLGSSHDYLADLLLI